MELKITGLDDLVMNMNNYGAKNNLALSTSMNRVGVTARKESLNHVSRIEKWNLSVTKFKAVSITKKATSSTVNLQFIMDSKSISLIDFKGTTWLASSTPRGKKRKGGSGVRFKLKGAGAKKQLAKSFTAKSKFGSHKELVFVKRRSPKGAEITHQASITPSSMFKQTGVDVYVDTFFKHFQDRYYSQMRYYKII